MRKYHLSRIGKLVTVAACIAPLGMALTLGCSAASRDRLKRFFFEVPDEQAAEATAEPEAVAGAVQRPTLLPPMARFTSVHPPYAAKQCVNCHDAAEAMHVRPDLLTACGRCHPLFFGDDVGHPPAVEGECLLCHQLHVSSLPSLLNQPVVDTCVDCHDEPEDLSEEAHGVANVEDCTACHDPHFGDSPFLKADAAPTEAP